MKCKQKTIDKVRRYGAHDTSKYRYIEGQFGTIVRCELAKLDTMEAFKPWEIVAVWDNDKQRYI